MRIFIMLISTFVTGIIVSNTGIIRFVGLIIPHITRVNRGNHKKVIPNINIASNYCDYIYVLKNGSIICCRTPREVLTKENIKNIFDVKCEVILHPKTKLPFKIGTVNLQSLKY